MAFARRYISQYLYINKLFYLILHWNNNTDAFMGECCLSTWIQYEWRWVYRHIPLELLNSYWTLYINPSSQTIFCLLYYIPGSTAEKQLAHTPILWFTCLTWAVNICNVGFRRRVNLKVEKVQVIPRVGSSQISYEGIVELLLFIMIWLMSRLLAYADDQIIHRK